MCHIFMPFHVNKLNWWLGNLLTLICKMTKYHDTSSSRIKLEAVTYVSCMLLLMQVPQFPKAHPVTRKRAQPASAPVVQLTVPILTGNPGGNSNLMKSLSLAKWALVLAMRSMMGMTCSTRERGKSSHIHSVALNLQGLTEKRLRTWPSDRETEFYAVG